MTRLLLPLLLLWPAIVQAQGQAQAQSCDATAPIAADGRVLGHLPYGEAQASELVPAPDGFALHPGCRMRPEVAADLGRLLDAARADSATGGELRGASCHRSLAWQEGVFCARPRGEIASDQSARAISVAPPGHSEHATGYAIDFAVRPSPNCPDVDGCMADFPAARWLLANARRFGFEESFPGGNKQNVKWEPWHWRWVGVSAAAPGGARARFIFARARREFPAKPMVP